jgi:PAS domain S-box-containing protein
MLWQNQGGHTSEMRSRPMTECKDTPRSLLAITRIFASSSGMIGLAAFAGWMFNVAALKSVLPGYISMQPWTTLGLLFGGISLYFATIESSRAKVISGLFATGLGFAAGLPLLEYLTGTSFGTDIWIFPARVVSAQTFKYPNPGRMSQAAASGLSAVACALLLSQHLAGRISRVAFTVLATFALTLAIKAWLDYVLRLETHDSMFMRNPLALHTALGLALLSIGTLTLRPGVGWVRMAIDYGRSGWMIVLSVELSALLLIAGVDAASRAGSIKANALTATHALETLLSTLKDAETGERGFTLTGRDYYLEPYDAARVRLEGDRAAVGAALSGVKDPPADLSRLSDLIDRRMAILAEVISLRRTHDFTETRALLGTDRGKDAMDAVRAEIAALERAVAEDAATRSARARTTAAAAAILLASLGGIGGWKLLVTLRAEREAVHARNEATGRLALFIDGAPAAIAMFDTGMHYIAVSRRFVTDYHLDDQTPQTLIGRCHCDFFPHIPERWRRIHQRVLAGEHLSADCDPVSNPDGTIHWQNWKMVPWRHSDGTIGGALLFTEDMTARRAAENAVRESEARLRLVQQVGRIGYFDRKLSEPTVMFNAEAAIMYGLPPDRTHTQAEEWLSWVYPPDLERVHATRKILFEQGGPVSLEFRIRRMDGAIRWMALRADICPGADGEPPHLVIAQHDITDIVASREALAESQARLRRTEAELSHALRVSTVGEMASTIAHELGQPLSAAGTFLEGCTVLLQRDAASDRTVVLAGLGRVADAVGRASSIVRDLHRFLRKEEAPHLPLDLHDAVGDAVRLGALGFEQHGGHVVMELADDLPMIVADRTQIQQVIINLVRNAVEAMANCEVRELRISAICHQGGVRLSLADTGPGLPPEIAHAPFKAFATTKENGLGLGLSICRSIVGAHQGTIEVKTGPQGTTFLVNLPAVRNKSDARAA